MIEVNSSLLTPLTIDKPEWKETIQMKKQPESATDMILEGETLVSQVTPLLGTIPSKNTQIQHRNMPEEFQTYWEPEFIKGMLTLHCRHWME